MIEIENLQDRVMQELDLSKEICDEELQEVIHRILERDTKAKYLSLREKAGIGKELFNTFRKLDILQEILEDDEITEIMINGTDNIFIEKDGRLLQLEKRFADRWEIGGCDSADCGWGKPYCQRIDTDCGCETGGWLPRQCSALSDCTKRTDCDDP